MTIWWTAKELEAYEEAWCPVCKCHNLIKTGRLKEAKCPICSTLFLMADAINYKKLGDYIKGEEPAWSTD